jgi:hypothetical protein
MRPEAPASYACDDTAEHRPFGKRNAVLHLIELIQTPFVMLRFIFGKAAWLTSHFHKHLCQMVRREPVLKDAAIRMMRSSLNGDDECKRGAKPFASNRWIA